MFVFLDFDVMQVIEILLPKRQGLGYLTYSILGMHIDRLMQERRNSSALAMELRL